MILTLLTLISLQSCSDDSDNNRELPKNTEFTVISNGALSGNGSEGIAQSNMIIDNTTDWESLMSQMNSVNNVTNSFFETDIDFDTYLVIAVFLEVKPSGWSVEIENITENDSTLFVSMEETESDTTVITQPFSIVKTLRTEKTIEFE